MKNLKREEKICYRCRKLIAVRYMKKHQETKNCKYTYFYESYKNPFLVHIAKSNKLVEKFKSLGYPPLTIFLKFWEKEIDAVSTHVLPINVSILLYMIFPETRVAIPKVVEFFASMGKPLENLLPINLTKKEFNLITDILDQEDLFNTYNEESKYLFDIGGMPTMWKYLLKRLEIKEK